jgi:hypothetical protein
MAGGRSSTGSPSDANCRDQNSLKQPNGSQQNNCATIAPSNYNVGFVGAHDGRTAYVVFVDYWGNENELFHRVFLSRSGDPNALIPAKSFDSSVCVWDLRLQSFEREAWIKHVLCQASAPDFHAYLEERLNDDG